MRHAERLSGATVVSARAAMSEDFPESVDLVASGRITLSPLVTQVLPVTELAQAIGVLESDADGRMKIIPERLIITVTHRVW